MKNTREYKTHYEEGLIYETEILYGEEKEWDHSNTWNSNSWAFSRSDKWHYFIDARAIKSKQDKYKETHT